ncbi:MAG TPA: hypothetical protein PKA64_15210 [Myxococcota bacterium]|nr:hypothetical protein [Myxococcota bacterium]
MTPATRVEIIVREIASGREVYHTGFEAKSPAWRAARRDLLRLWLQVWYAPGRYTMEVINHG